MNTFFAMWLMPLVLLGGGLTTVSRASPLTWVSILWLGVLGTGLAYLLYFSLLRNIGATQVVVVTYILPIVGIALGVMLLDEQLTLSMAVGLALILGGAGRGERDTLVSSGATGVGG